jgi:hypothetical protein
MALGHGQELAMNPQWLDSDPSGLSIIVTIFLREEPDEDEEEGKGGEKAG